MAEATLEELKTARDKIAMGRNVVECGSGDEVVKYGPGNLQALNARIRELEAPRGPSTLNLRISKGW